MKKVLGVILELNPFHNGHFYFLQKSKEQIKPDYTIAVVSGNYTMRGNVSVIDKSTKASLLLEAGVDIVLDLPFISAVNSADYFAAAAVGILNEFLITDISFGAELNNLEKLKQMQQIIKNDEFNFLTRKFLNSGFSYPTACFRALKEFSADEELIGNFTLPNNTLAVQYIRCIENSGRKINITPVQRIANNYYEGNITGQLSSATAIRELLRENKDITPYIPKFAGDAEYIDIKQTERNMYLLLKYRFIDKKSSDFENVFGVGEGIENRFASLLNQKNDYRNFIATAQTKRYPQNRIQRLILHILLGTDKKYEATAAHYIRLTGATKKGLHYIGTLSAGVKNKIITSFKNNNDEIVLTELKASRLYDLLTGAATAKNEFKMPIVKN